MYCPGCGAQVSDNATFCPKCGRELKPHDPVGKNKVWSLINPAVIKKVIVALVAVAIIGGVGFGVTRFLGSRPPKAFKMINQSPEKIAKRLDDMVAVAEGDEDDKTTLYFSSQEFADYFKTASEAGMLGSNVNIPKKYAGDYMIVFIKNGSLRSTYSSIDTLSKKDMSIGLKPGAILYLEVTKKKVPDSKKFAKQLKRSGLKYDRIFAVTVDDMSAFTSFVGTGAGTSAYYYNDSTVGAAGIASVGDTRLWCEVACLSANDAIGVQDIFEKIDDPETLSQALERLGSEGGNYYIE